MKFLRPLLGLTRLDKKRNTEIREQLNVINIVQEIEDYKKWFELVERMQDNRLPKIIIMNTSPREEETADVQGQDGQINFIFRDRNRLESLNLKCFRQDKTRQELHLNKTNLKLKSYINSCAVAQAVSCRLLVSQARVLVQGSPVIFVADQVALRQFFL
jgi:hypothetical protein